VEQLFLAAALVGTVLFGTGSKTTINSPPVNTALPEIIGLDTVGSGLYAKTGSWDNTPTSFACNWHLLGSGTSLSTSCGTAASPAVTLTSGQIGSRIQVDVIATNAAGSSPAALSDFVGTIEIALPSPPPVNAGPAPTALPVYPSNFLENSHAIYPGCVVPPVAPDTSNPLHVWYFDTINGHTLASGATGHVGDPFNSPQAIFGGIQGYGSLAGFTSVGPVTSTQAFLNGTAFGAVQGGGAVYVNGIKQGIQAWGNTSIEINLVPPGVTPTTGNTEVDVGLFSRSMQPGDVAYIEPDPSGASVGSLIGSAYSTNTGTATGTVNYTWIMKDPAASTNPVLSGLTLSASAGFLFSGINYESNGATLSASKGVGTQAWFSYLISITGNASAPTHDIAFENFGLSSWIGHSADPWPGAYPTTNGHSDGTILTASPYMGSNASDPAAFIVSASANSNQLMLENGIPFISTTTGPFTAVPYIYVWSPGYYYQVAFSNSDATPPTNTGIPNGTKILDINGFSPNTLINMGNVATSGSLPATAVLNEAFFALDTHHLWVGNSTPAWVDQGQAYVTIGTCDPTTDHNTGCPSTLTSNGTPFIGCDPIVFAAPNTCQTTTKPVWNGTTRALTSETIILTPRMIMPPAGWWNNVDWALTANAINFGGGLNASPNDVEGVTCTSVKNGTLRDVWNAIAYGAATNSISYNDRVKYRTEDAWKVYSSHRIIIANSFTSDATYIKGHEDIIQYAQLTGPNDAQFYGNAAVNVEGYTHVDPNDQFVDYTQAIGETDQVYSGTYYADNIVFNSDNPMFAGGLYNVVVNNDAFHDFNGTSGGVKINSGGKANQNVASFSLMANNVANNLSRNQSVPGIGSDCTLDSNTVENNLSISLIDWSTSPGSPTAASANSNIYCNGTGVTNSSSAGVFPDLNAWAPVDWRNGASNPLFTAVNPLPPQALPAAGAGIMSTNFCLRNEVNVGTCSPGDPGRLDMRPNASFVPTSPIPFIGGTNQLTNLYSLPTSGTIGDAYLVANADVCVGGFTICTGVVGNTYPAGIFTRATGGTNILAYNITPFNPGIIGVGASLGAQMPPANHARQAWTSPPNIGAY
jgi:hypothetical protein